MRGKNVYVTSKYLQAQQQHPLVKKKRKGKSVEFRYQTEYLLSILLLTQLMTNLNLSCLVNLFFLFVFI